MMAQLETLPVLTSKLNKTRFLNYSAKKGRTPFQQWVSSREWVNWQKPTTGQTQLHPTTANALRGTARKWHFSMVNLETEVQLKWSDFKDQFKAQYKQ
jgi:hypothetical protein